MRVLSLIPAFFLAASSFVAAAPAPAPAALALEPAALSKRDVTVDVSVVVNIFDNACSSAQSHADSISMSVFVMFNAILTIV